MPDLLTTLRDRLNADPRTWYAVAKAANVDAAGLKRYADGERVPTIAVAERIASALGCKIELVETAAD